MAIPREDPLKRQIAATVRETPARGIRPQKQVEGESVGDHEDATNPHPGYILDGDFVDAEGFMRKVAAGIYTVHKSNLAGTAAPTANDDASAGYSVGSVWVYGTSFYVCTNAGVGTANWEDLTSAGATDGDAIHDNVASEISAITEKVTPVNADLLLIEDSAAGNAKKRVQAGNLPGGGTHASSHAESGSDDLVGQNINVRRLKIEDTDGTPTDDLILKVLDAILYVRNSADTNTGDAVFRNFYMLSPDVNGVLLKCAGIGGLLQIRAGDDTEVGNVLVKTVSTDTVGELTGANGVNVDGLLIKDGAHAQITGTSDLHTEYQKESEKNAANGYAGLTAGTKLNLAQMQEVMAHADLTDSPADAHHNEAHGIAAHTAHATWKVLYTDGSGDEQELSLGAAPSATLGHTYLRSAGVSSAPTMAEEMKTISLTVEDPTNAEDISIAFFFQAVTVREVQCVVVGSATPSVTINPKHATDRSAAGTALLNAATAITNTTTGQNLTSFTDNTLVADSFLWLETTAQSGTVDELHITIRYTVD